MTVIRNCCKLICSLARMQSGHVILNDNDKKTALLKYYVIEIWPYCTHTYEYQSTD